MVMVEAPAGWTPDDTPSTASAGSPMLLSASTFVPPKPSKTPPSATPGSIAANVGSSPAVPKATAWKDPPPNATPTGEVLPKDFGSRHRIPSSALENAAAAPTLAPVAPQVSAAPPSEIAQPTEDAAPAPATSAWPRWFLPGIGATIALALIIFVLRLLLQSSDTEPVNVVENQPTPPVVETVPPAELTSGTSAAPNSESTATDVPPASTFTTNTDSTTPPLESVPAAAPENPPATESPVAQSPPAAETPVVTPPAAGDVPPEPAPPGSNEIAKSDPIQPVAPPATPDPQAPAADAQAKQPLVRVPPRQVSLESRLADPIRSLEVRNMPLHQLLDMLGDLSAVPISLDVDAFEQMNRSPATAVPVQINNKTVAETLDAVLAPQGLGYDLERGLVVVGHPQRETLRPISYTLTDLAADDAALGKLAGAVRQLIAPSSWQQNGGKASMAAGSGKIAIEQTPAVHYRLLVFCEKLRVARGLPIKSKHDPAKFLLKTREAKASDLLKKPIKANFGTPQPLAGVVAWLRHVTKATILVDHAALADAETSVESHCSAVSDGKPLATLFDELLTPMELTWRVVDATTIEITTPQAAAERDEIEFYAVKDLAANAADANTLVEKLKAELGPSIANQNQNVAIHFDEPSKTLIVRAPQRLQAQLEAVLTIMHGQK
jgi:hypothetical protein